MEYDNCERHEFFYGLMLKNFKHACEVTAKLMKLAVLCTLSVFMTLLTPWWIHEGNVCGQDLVSKQKNLEQSTVAMVCAFLGLVSSKIFLF